VSRRAQLGFHPKRTAWLVGHSRHIAREVERLAPAVRRGDKRPDHCEYPREDAGGRLHVPLEGTFAPSRLTSVPGGRAFLKLVRGAIGRFL